MEGFKMQNKYVPSVLVAGDVEEFRARIGNKAANIVGSVSFFGEFNDQPYSLTKYQTLLLNGELIEIDTFKNLIKKNEFDYIVFTDYLDFGVHSIYLANNVLNLSRILMIDTFLCDINNGFYSFYNEINLYKLLSSENITSLLDIDSFFLNGQVYVKPKEAQNLKLEGIRNTNKDEYKIFANVYDNIYDSLKDCCLRHYDAILLAAERSWEDLKLKIYETLNMTETFILFVRSNSELNGILARSDLKREFKMIQYASVFNGRWYILNIRKPTDIKIYMVTHKKHTLSKLPEDYITIHAGRALNEYLGYQGDDTGQSISNLNPYLNEMTAAYWIWKNTSHDYVGIAHYRRFFTLDDSPGFAEDKIITGEQAIELLQKYDILVAKEEYHVYNLYSFLIRDVGVEVTFLAMNLTKKMIERYQPDYLDVFDYSVKSGSLYKCNMIITRKHIYDTYCQWLFSFLLEAESEFRKLVPIENLSTMQKRVFGFISERMLTVWLIKNRLRIYELTVIENK